VKQLYLVMSKHKVATATRLS